MNQYFSLDSHISRIICWRKAWLGWTLRQLEKLSTGCLRSSLNWPPVTSAQMKPVRWHLEKRECDSLFGSTKAHVMTRLVQFGEHGSMNSLWGHFFGHQEGRIVLMGFSVTFCACLIVAEMKIRLFSSVTGLNQMLKRSSTCTGHLHVTDTFLIHKLWKKSLIMWLF